MTIIKHMLSTALLLATASSCRPSASDNYLFDTSTDQIRIDVTVQNQRMIFKAPAGKKITKIKSISVAKERVGKFTAAVDKKYISMFSETDKPVYDIELTLDLDSNCRSATNGVTLVHGGSFNVGCVSQSALVAQLKTVCKDLATDTTVATFDETKETCSCLTRVNKNLKYTDYLGRPNAFKLECKNSGTVEQLKAFCSEIKDRQCPTCVVENISCQCPKNVTLSYANFLTDVEQFRSQCENPVATTDTKPIDPNLTAIETSDLFATECKKVGVMSSTTDGAKCRCSNGLSVEMSQWKKNQTVLEATCTDDLEIEILKPAKQKKQSTKTP